MIVMMDTPPETVAAWVEATAAIVGSGVAIAPVFVIDGVDFGPARHHQFLTEYVPPVEHWTGLGLDPEDAEARRDEAVRFLARQYRPDTIVRVSGGSPSSPGDSFRSLLEGTSA